MTLATSLRATLFSARSIAGTLGLRPHTVTARLRAYSGGELGQGGRTETLIPITQANGQPPQVRSLSNEQLAVAGYDKETWEIGPITPAFPGGGTLIETLTNSALGPDTEPHFVLKGPTFPSGANFRAVRTTTDKALHYMIQVQRVADGGA